MLGQLAAVGAVAAGILPQQGLKRRLLKHIEQKQLSPAPTDFRLQASEGFWAPVAAPALPR